MNPFTCLSLSPIELDRPSLAVATTRAGGIGVLDREFCSDRDLGKAARNLDKLLELVDELAAVGLRLRVDQIAQSQILLKRLCTRPHWIILCGWTEQTVEQTLAALPTSSSRRLLLEVTDIEQTLALSSLVQQGQGGVDGLIAKGHESGGWVGEDSAFVLTQKLIEKQSLPIYVQGGIGIHTAAACYAAGARGVVLDDQLWLMPESPLPTDWQRYLNNLNGQEAIVVGERISSSCRVLSRPGFQAIPALQKLAEEVEGSRNWGLETNEEDTQRERHGNANSDSDVRVVPLSPCPLVPLSSSSLSHRWQQQAQSLLGWGTPGTVAWPMGQAVGVAASIRDRYKTTGRFVQALLKASREHVKIAQKLQPLGPNAPLAVSHGTNYPIVQGPMTRVSDTAEFANAVSQAGGLPLLALALMRGEQVRGLLQKTKALLGDRSWGIGILGFVPQAVREEQLKEVKAVKPPFALIAGGRPDQAAHLEAQGIATYLHVPVPTLLKMFLEQGARRFVFEGRECGGHVGPLSSFLLWESMIETLLQEVPKGAEQEVHVLFAGGIHDARSTAMVSAMAAPLAERGIRIGVLMGSAYLFTEEAVSCGAIVKEFQATAIACTRTVNLETGPGHASRCAITPFAQEFYATRSSMLANGSSPEEIKNALEHLTLGRLRIASKGLNRDAVGQIVAVDVEKQIRDGMYMIGQVATLRDKACSIQALHENVSVESTQLISTLAVDATAQSNEAATQPSDIAIIGIATLLPQAQHPEQFWENILKKIDTITEIPSSRWDWRLYYDSNRNARDKVYSKWGGFIDDVPFDPIRFGIPPKSLKSIEPLQLLALETVRRALDDAGLASGEFDRENTSVILGAGGGIADLGQQYATRSEIPRFVEAPSENVWERLPEWTEESFPGLLLNVIAGRVANRLDFGGSNFTVDAACASSLAAIDLAVKELESGRSNVAIAGGVDTVQSPFAYLCFSKTQALSAQGKTRTFDKSADGIVISEGIAVVVLKRLADAQRDGDRIYAVIKAVAGSSDGKALGMTAPLPAGQMRAVNRAYKKAGFSPKTLGLYEAHGTGTVAGDRAELETIVSTLKADQTAGKACAIGSVKTMIGHTKSTAGVAGLVKVALSLHHKVLPPHVGVETPLDAIADPESPVYLLKEAQPWLRRPDYPRRASVSAFGFGGTNFHAVLEEYQGELNETGIGAEAWPCELLVWRASNREALTEDVRFLLAALEAGAEPRLPDLAYTLAKQAGERQNYSASLTLVVSDLQQLKQSLGLTLAHLEGKSSHPLPLHIQLGWETPKTNSRIAFLFPGQGAQYPEMAREVALYFKEMRQALEFADQQLQSQLPKLLSQFIYPPSAYSEADEVRNQQQLTDTRIAQPAIGAVESGYLDIVAKLGLKADMVAGHSYGEYAALYAAGVLSREEFLTLSDTRGRVMATACEASDGAMAAVQITREDLLQRISNCQKVVLANHNAPLQSVISGEREKVEQIVDSLNVVGIMARMLPVAGAFHSALVESAQEALAQAIATAKIESPKIPVYANSTARPYDCDVDAIRNQLSKHVISPVEFVGQIDAMYDNGARIFVEVGPKSILTKLVSKILEDRKHTVVSLDSQGGKLQGLLQALGTLVTRGVGMKLTALFEGRQVQQLDLSRLVELTRKPDLPPTACLLNGGSVRSPKEAIGYTGKIPPLSLETAAQAHKQREIRQQERREEPVNKTVPPTTKPTMPVVQRPKPASVNPIIQPASALPMSMPSSNGASHPQVPPVSHSNHHVPVSQDAALAAYQAYQQTMRQFLSVQEQVMRQFLSGGQASPIVPPTPAPTPVPQIPTSAPPVLLNGNHNGNGGVKPPEQIPAPKQVSTFYPAPAPEVRVPPTVEPVVKAEQEVQGKNGSSTPGIVRIDRAGLLEILLQLVSDRTGYPVEMLGLDQDLEAELGIDSIKRVEILGALQKTLPSPLASSIQERMESLTRVKSLNGMVEQLLSTVQTTAVTTAPTSQMAATGGTQSFTSLADKTTLTQTLLRLVSDRTGYPTEMLGLEQDLEAELGIDSIKRVEILGALQKSLPGALAASMQSNMEKLTRVKSLNSIVDQLLALATIAPIDEEKSLGKFLTGGKASRAI
jgi:acyl transferase domain-containing protein/NAD(P)H-dependent flavin oxidoreductase YrpB (nitropropane dioxygenase family)/acyl carrier protein